MSTLHTVNKSPFQDNSLASCLTLCNNGDSVLLIEDGAYGAAHTSPCADHLKRLLSDGTKIYALENDVKARGLQLLLEGIELTDYKGFVELSCAHHCIQSWY